MIDRLILGSAQFGQLYGISNAGNIVDRKAAARILDVAYGLGIRFIDTAAVYGDSERLLGLSGARRFAVVTKLPRIPVQTNDVKGWAKKTLGQSLKKLRISAAHAVLVHDADELLGRSGEKLYAALLDLKREGMSEYIGASVYSEVQVRKLSQQYVLDVVQAPNNPLDHRFTASAWREHSNSSDSKLHIRSIFLQGLLLLDEKEQCRLFPEWRGLWGEWATWLKKTDQTAVGACVRYAAMQAHAAGVVVGVLSAAQLTELALELDKTTSAIPKFFSTQDLGLINPGLWKVPS